MTTQSLTGDEIAELKAAILSALSNDACLQLGQFVDYQFMLARLISEVEQSRSTEPIAWLHGPFGANGAPIYAFPTKKGALNYDAQDLSRSVRAEPIPVFSRSLPIEGWRGIETAPKDGTRFIGFDGRNAYPTEHGRLYVKWPHEEGGPTYSDVWNRVTPGQICPWNITHWMPLPSPPSGGL